MMDMSFDKLFAAPTPAEVAAERKANRAAIAELKELHGKLAKADKQWTNAKRVAQDIDALAAQVEKLWFNLPGNRRILFDAVEHARYLMRVVLAAVASEEVLSHSWDTRTFLGEVLDELFDDLAAYLEEVRDET